MELELKYGRWQTKSGKQWKDLDVVEKKIFDILIGVEKIIKKYNL
jgi:hypothetical protein